MQSVDPLHLCPECYVVKTPRSRHCGVCNKCIERYDHHCPWVNNCIGIKNHRSFMLFITFLIVTMVTIFINCIGELLNLQSQAMLDESMLNYDFLPKELVVNRSLYIVLNWVTIILTGFFLLPVFLLLYIQVKNFLKNRTTNERFSKRKPLVPANPKIDRAVSVDTESERADSTGSSLLSVIEQLKQAEDIIKEHGEPRELQGGCLWIRNITEMTLNTKMPD